MLWRKLYLCLMVAGLATILSLLSLALMVAPWDSTRDLAWASASMVEPEGTRPVGGTRECSVDASARTGITETAFFVEDQVIVTGSPRDIDDVIEVNLCQKGTITDLVLADTILMSDFVSDRAGKLEIRLYTIADTWPVTQVVSDVNSCATLNEKEVSAEPNYLTANPWTGGGSPWTGGGSPVPGGAGGSAPESLFWDQWAFGESGIGLFKEGSFGQEPVRSVPYTGQGARVGVFDTSLFTVPEGEESEETFEWISLTVSHPVPAATLMPPPGAQDIRDHGIYVAGLVQAVAPESDIHLIRVLNDYGQGDLYTLDKALHGFIDDTLTVSQTLTGAVINLSLGVRQVPNPSASGLLTDVVSLEKVLSTAHDLGFVVAAAAGNESTHSTVEFPHIPARWPCVIGVSASNIEGERACFSNLGNVAAPGGDGSGQDCHPVVSECFTDTTFCLISLAHPTTHYAYWTGTSFATPLVSGLAALVLEKDGSWSSPGLVARTIYEGATPSDLELGAGVINVPRTLEEPAPCDFYVDDSNPGRGAGVWDNPFNTIQQGMDAAAGAGGGIVCVAEGIYRENVVMKSGVVLRGGYEARGWTRDIAGHPSIVDGGGYDPSNEVQTYGIRLGELSDAVVSGFWVTNAEELIQVSASSNVRIEKNYLHDTVGNNYTFGVRVRSTETNASTNILIANNVIKDIIGSGWRGGGISVGYQRADWLLIENISILNNTVYNVSQDSIFVDHTSGAEVKNNIAVKVSPTVYLATGIDKGDFTTDFDADYNLVYDTPELYHGYPGGPNDVNADPLFVDPAGGNLHLQMSSPAIDAGTSLPEVVDDIDGRPRCQGEGYDVGACETRLPAPPWPPPFHCYLPLVIKGGPP
jgi:subtilisin family serine protease